MRVLQLGHGVGVRYAGLLLAELGAQVTSVGAATSNDELDASTRAFLDRHQTPADVELGTRAGTLAVLELARSADGLVEDLGPGGLQRFGLGPRRLRRARHGLIIASLTPFGQVGPHAGWAASELVVQAMGGLVHATGWDGEPPLKLADHVAELIAGLHGAIAVCSGVFGVRRGTERGVQIDIAMQEAFLQHWSRHIGQWSYNGTGTRRDSHDFTGQGVPTAARAADGWLCLAVRNARWDTVAEVFGLTDYLGPEWQDGRVRAARWSEIQPRFEAAVARRTRAEWLAAAAARGLIVGPIQDLPEVLANEQYAARGYFTTIDVDGVEVPCPRLPFPWTVDEARLASR